MVVAVFGLGVGLALGATGSQDTPVPVTTNGTTILLPAEKAAALQNENGPAQINTGVPTPPPPPPPTGQIAPIPASLADAADASIPLSPELINVTNTWLVSDGHHLVAVYAGSAGNDPSLGRIVIIRQNLDLAQQTQHVVDVPGGGSLKIDNPPLGAAVETTALTAHLPFTSQSGDQEHLDLVDDSIAAGG
ncbi:MAG TPA: hypothetical protein VFU33_03170 [Gaiellaceae bacterium]|nr:hypothetical protein [Gaiellaceae bacterium]